MVVRFYFLTSEIVPFAETYELATFSKEFPNVFIERKNDFRVMMPKYEFISERRYILREVIRLRSMNVQFVGTELKAAVKSAFIPNTKVQVYFLENKDYFSPEDPEKLYEEGEGENNKNYNKFGYFAVSSLTTLEYLRWKPEVIICNDWQMGLIPVYLRMGLIDNDFAKDAKIVLFVHSKSEKSLYPISFFERLGVKDIDEKCIVEGFVDVSLLAMKLVDEIIFVDIDGTNPYGLYNKESSFKKVVKGKCVHKFSIKDMEDPDEWQEIADNFIKIFEK